MNRSGFFLPGLTELAKASNELLPWNMDAIDIAYAITDLCLRCFIIRCDHIKYDDELPHIAVTIIILIKALRILAIQISILTKIGAKSVRKSDKIVKNSGCYG